MLGPWFTGPLLVPAAECNPKGDTSWQPYIFVNNTFGEYDSHWHRQNTPNTWSVTPLIDVTYGLSSFIDIEAVASFVYNYSQGSSAVRLTDWSLFLGFQPLRDTPGTWEPNLRITLQQVFPFGQYKHLNPKKNGTDGTGRGAYQTGVNFTFDKAFHYATNKYFSIRWSLGYLFAFPVHIDGLSVYGGAPDTSGKVFPGQTFIGYLSGEVQITQNWAFACDTEYLITRHDRFSGKPGTEDGEKALVGNPFSVSISIAPAIEYSYSENFGLIGGVWFSLAGKNASQFFGGVFSVVINY
ncbi:hypothetical protein [Simkania sp.]|uniref:hypothetical protein n=1 Tax=Simkania sp. TaxID=34094 RepID=UPI003B51C345